MRLQLPAPRHLVPRLAILAGLALCGSVLRADFIAGNFNTGGTYSTGTGVNVTDGTSDFSVSVEFTASANYDLSSIEFIATNDVPDPSDGLTLGIYANVSGHPGGTALESFSVSGPLPEHWQVDLVTPITVNSVLKPLLVAGTPYWVEMDGPTSATLYWDQNTAGKFGIAETDGKGNWLAPAATSGTTQGVFEVDGDLVSGGSSAPEPHAWFLMAGGLAVVARAMRAAYSPPAREAESWYWRSGSGLPGQTPDAGMTEFQTEERSRTKPSTSRSPETDSGHRSRRSARRGFAVLVPLTHLAIRRQSGRVGNLVFFNYDIGNRGAKMAFIVRDLTACGSAYMQTRDPTAGAKPSIPRCSSERSGDKCAADGQSKSQHPQLTPDQKLPA